MRIGIIGGGAAGIVASIAASQNIKDKRQNEVVILEKTASVLNKFVLSGGGRCNISNENLTKDKYNGGSKNFISNVLKSFGKTDMLSLLMKIGDKYTIEKDGKIYTGDARETAHRLIKYSISLGTKIRYRTSVEKIRRLENGFIIEFKGKEEFFDRIILATGGKSLPETGSDGFGYVLAESLGHTIVHPLPGLVSLDLKPNPFGGLSGITIDAEIILENKRLKILEKERGSLLITHRGISGPVTHNISGRYIRISRERGTGIYINFFPDISQEELDRFIQTNINTSGKKKIINLLSNFMPDRLAAKLLTLIDIPNDRTLSELKREERINLINNLKRFNINISGTSGFRLAHVTTGGVALNEVNFATMESKKVKGLYFAGEVLDVDGLEGGYNLHWAFATGFISGKNASMSK